MFIDRHTLTTLLQLEALFHEKVYNINHVTKMLEIYSDFVQLFDNQKSLMKDYFLEKIQYVVSRPETIQLLNKQNIEQLQEEHDISKKRFSVYKRAQVNELKILQQMQSDQDNQAKNVNELLVEYDQVAQDIDKQIKEQLNTQVDLLQQRRMNRKLKSNVIVKSVSTDQLQKPDSEIETKLSNWKLLNLSNNDEFAESDKIN